MRERPQFLWEAGEFLHEQQHEVPEAPAKKRPVRTVPDARERPDNEEIVHPTPPRDPVAAQRDIDIVAEPSAEGDMPPPPELRRAPRDIRIIEVLHEVEPEHASETNRHIAVPGKIKVNLQRIGKRAIPGRREREAAAPSKILSATTPI